MSASTYKTTHRVILYCPPSNSGAMNIVTYVGEEYVIDSAKRQVFNIYPYFYGVRPSDPFVPAWDLGIDKQYLTQDVVGIADQIHQDVEHAKSEVWDEYTNLYSLRWHATYHKQLIESLDPRCEIECYHVEWIWFYDRLAVHWTRIVDHFLVLADALADVLEGTAVNSPVMLSDCRFGMLWVPNKILKSYYKDKYPGDS